MTHSDIEARIEHLRTLALAGGITRRQLLRRATALGLTAPAVAVLLAACGGDDEEAAPTATRSGSAAPTTASSGSGSTSTGSPTSGAGSPVSSGPAPKPASNQTVVYAEGAGARSIDPANALESNSLHVTRALYEGLVAHKTGTTEIIPRLAKEWSISSDARVYTFTLQDNVKFHDGTVMDAEAVKKSYDRVMQLNLGPAALLRDVDQVRAVDPRTVEIVLKRPHAYFMTYVTKIGIVSPSAIEANDRSGDLGAAWLEEGNSAGTGPYKLTQYRKNELELLERNPDYWRGWDGPHLQKIEIQIVPEGSTRRQMLENSEAHFVGRLNPDDLKSLESVDGVNVVVSKNFEIDIITLNINRPPLNNIKVRQAIQYAFDYEGFLNQVRRGWGNLPTGPIAPGYPGHDPSLPAFKRDMARARQLLQEAGVSNVTLEKNYVENNVEEQQSGLILQAALKELGITLELKPLPWSTMFAIAGSTTDAMHMSNLLMSTFTADPTFTLNQNYGCDFVGKPYNWSYYCNQQAQTLIDDAASTLDQAESVKKLQEAQKLIVQDAPAIFYANPSAVEALSDKIQNYAWDPVDYYWQVDWYNIWLSE